MDFAGIGIYFAISSLPAIYYKFYNDIVTQSTYTALNVICGLSFSYFVIKKTDTQMQIITSILFAVTQLTLALHILRDELLYSDRRGHYIFLTCLEVYMGAIVSGLIGGVVYFWK